MVVGARFVLSISTLPHSRPMHPFWLWERLSVQLNSMPLNLGPYTRSIRISQGDLPRLPSSADQIQQKTRLIALTVARGGF